MRGHLLGARSAGVLCVAAVLCAACATSGAPPGGASRVQVRPATPLGPPPVMHVLASGLSDPFELLWGPDDHLWVTEKLGRKVDRVDPATGAKTTVLSLPQAEASGAQDGVLGMAFQGDSLFLVYDYGPLATLQGKIVRYRYDKAAATLSDPVDVLAGLPASPDHNAGRLITGPDGKLYYSLGDLGNNQFDRACLPIRSQDLPTQAQVDARDWSSYAGKVLRIDPDGSIPPDNPVIHGVRSHVFTYGHRNPEGLVVGPGGRIYSSEHGPKSDDEINILRPGKNYGWPFVAGYRDGEAYRYANWSAAPDCHSLTYDDYTVPPSVPLETPEPQWNDPDYVDPIKTFYTVPTGYNFQDPACTQEYDLCWPSIAPGSIGYLSAQDAPTPQLANVLLVPSLKEGTLFAVRLSGDGAWAQGDVQQLFPTRNRYRDVALGPDHTKIYIATDSEGSSGPQSLQQTGTLDNPGSILEFTVTGSPQVQTR
jgi:PQQ-dependent dehydrogenase (s-GDH family)